MDQESGNASFLWWGQSGLHLSFLGQLSFDPPGSLAPQRITWSLSRVRCLLNCCRLDCVPHGIMTATGCLKMVGQGPVNVTEVDVLLVEILHWGLLLGLQKRFHMLVCWVCGHFCPGSFRCYKIAHDAEATFNIGTGDYAQSCLDNLAQFRGSSPLEHCSLPGIQPLVWSCRWESLIQLQGNGLELKRRWDANGGECRGSFYKTFSMASSPPPPPWATTCPFTPRISLK